MFFLCFMNVNLLQDKTKPGSIKTVQKGHVHFKNSIKLNTSYEKPSKQKFTPNYGLAVQ